MAYAVVCGRCDQIVDGYTNISDADLLVGDRSALDAVSKHLQDNPGAPHFPGDLVEDVLRISTVTEF